MNKSSIISAAEALKGAPLPHFLVGGCEISADNRHLTATVVFPSSDPTIGSRVKPVAHVNQAHHLFAAWNGAHILKGYHGVDSLLALRSTLEEEQSEIRTPHVTVPDVPCRMEAEITHIGSRQTREFEGQMRETVTGTYRASFFQERDGVEQVVAEIKTPWIGFYS